MENREIKFRAFDGRYKKIHYKVVIGNVIDQNENYTAHAVFLRPGDTDYNIPEGGQWMNFDENSDYVIMQYTGLKDKKGNQIFEGDILRLDEYGGVEVPVVFESGAFCIKGFNWKVQQSEVIGNIYQTRSLIPLTPNS